MAEVKRTWAVTPKGIGRKDYSKAIEVFTPQPELLYFEGFEDLPQSFSVGGSAGYNVARITATSWRGGACLRMMTGNAPANNYASFLKRFGIGRTRQLLLELAFSFSTNRPGTGLTFRLGRQKGDGLAYGGVTYDVENESWYLGRMDLDTVEYIRGGDQSLYKEITSFHRLFLAVDFDAEEYLYLRCNDLTMDLSGIPITLEASVIDPYAFVFIYLSSDVLTLQELCVDDVKVSELG